MKLIFFILPLCFALAYGQFGGLGGLGGGAGSFGSGAFNRGSGAFSNAINRGVSSIGSALKNVPILNNVKDFADFAKQTGRTYATAAEKALHEEIFKSRKSFVDANNKLFAAGKSTFETGINAFSDFTPTEFLKKLTGNRKSAKGEAAASRHRQRAEPPAASKLPDSFDWREKGGVTPVKFQGECGSCWSFATTGAIEGHYFRKTGKLINLSEQNLIDCGKEDMGLAGCDGGFQEYAFEFITNQKGVAKSDGYPYLDKKDTCKYKPNLKGAEINGFAKIDEKDEETMKKVIATLGPVACSVNGLESLLLYKRGIYSDEECNKGEVNHSVLVVGYGSENGQDYWIVKNSWDKAWGEEGYFRLPRGKNFCGIATECSYPIV
ncbi:procathepsin L [Musca vetustissima]|uniref:procathepsin L n=1 Tax=Musca vetustissima TaxID=27455 RepID=UPI002AB6F90B|nr:procathepsin L [Musca vetustissima]